MPRCAPGTRAGTSTSPSAAPETLTGPGEAAAVAILDRDFDNLRSAHAWSIEHGDVDLALRLVAALREYAFRCMHAEITSWADAAIEVPGAEAHPRFPVVVAVAAYGRFVRGDLEGAIELGERALAAAGALGVDCSGLAERTLGNAWFYRGDTVRGTEWMDRMVASAREGSPARLAHALYMRSVAYTSVGDNVKGAQLAGEASAAAAACSVSHRAGPGALRARSRARVDRSPTRRPRTSNAPPTSPARPATDGSRRSP